MYKNYRNEKTGYEIWAGDDDKAVVEVTHNTNRQDAGWDMVSGDFGHAHLTVVVTLAIPEYAGGVHCVTCGAAVVGSDSRYFRPGAGWGKDGPACATCYATYLNMSHWDSLSWGWEPDPEREQVREMAVEYDKDVDLYMRRMAEQGAKIADMRHGYKPNDSDAQLSAADAMYHLADTTGNCVRWREQCYIRLAEIGRPRYMIAADTPPKCLSCGINKRTPGSSYCTLCHLSGQADAHMLAEDAANRYFAGDTMTMAEATGWDDSGQLLTFAY